MDKNYFIHPTLLHMSPSIKEGSMIDHEQKTTYRPKIITLLFCMIRIEIYQSVTNMISNIYYYSE